MSEHKNHPYIEPGYKPISIPEWPTEPTAAPLSHDVARVDGLKDLLWVDPAHTLDASGYNTNQIINLTPGSLSSIGGICSWRQS